MMVVEVRMDDEKQRMQRVRGERTMSLALSPLWKTDHNWFSRKPAEMKQPGKTPRKHPDRACNWLLLSAQSNKLRTTTLAERLNGHGFAQMPPPTSSATPPAHAHIAVENQG